MRRVAVLLVAVAIVLSACGGDDAAVSRGDAGAGAEIYQSYCATCHGPQGAGVAEAGPPLVHPLYDEAVYPDADFVAAVRRGATSDAWDFPIMPAVPGLDAAQIGDVLAFVRQLQSEGR